MARFKWVMFIFVMVFVVSGFMACGGDSSIQSDSASEDQAGDFAPDNSADTQVNSDVSQSEDEEVTPMEEQANGVSLPEGYPVELVPIMEDAESGWGIGSGGGFNLSYSTPSSAEKVLEFYTSHFSKYGDAFVVSDNKQEISLEAEGKEVKIYIDEGSDTTSLRITIN